MARLFTGGFEFGHPQVEGLGVVGAAAIQTSVVRTGARAGSTPGAGDRFSRTLTTIADRRYWLREAFYVTATPTTDNRRLCGGGNAGWFVGLNTSGVLELRSFAGVLLASGGSPSNNAWHVLEVDWTIPSSGDGQIGVWLDDVEVISRAAQSIGNTQLTSLYFGNNAAGASGGDCYLDDLAINDDQGAAQNTRPGDGKVYVLRPVSDPGTSSANWEKPGGATTDRHTSVANIPPVYEAYDPDATSAEDYVRNAADGPADLNLVTAAYDTLVPVDHMIALIRPIASTGSSSATDTAGTLGSPSNPTTGQASFSAFDGGVASSTPSTWLPRFGSTAYVPSVNRSLGATLRLAKTTATTRVALVNALGLLVEAMPPILVSGGVAAETDTALASTSHKTVLGGVGAEMDTALEGQVPIPGTVLPTPQPHRVYGAPRMIVDGEG